MINQPTPEQLAVLSAVERMGYRIADWTNRTVKMPLIWWNRTFMFFIIWLCLGRRLKVHHLERIQHLDADSRIILAANHRTFFDFFVITWVNYTFTQMPKRIFFPVRSTFFYDRVIGIVLNFIMGAYSMFPPIMRAAKKKPFNAYALQRITEELQDQGVIVGFHPEGTRNKDPDHTKLLPARAGVGEVIRNTPVATTIPVFIAGPTNRVVREFFVNWFAAKKNPVVVYYGAPIETQSFMSSVSNRALHQEIADHCMKHIVELSEEYRSEYEDIYPILKRNEA